MSAVEVVTAAMAAYSRGDLDAMAALVDPDADIEVIGLGGQTVHGADELREALNVVDGPPHRPTMTTVEPLADDAALMIGRVQYGDSSGAFWDRPTVWLSLVRDGKIWRSRAFSSRAEARKAYPRLSRDDYS